MQITAMRLLAALLLCAWIARPVPVWAEESHYYVGIACGGPDNADAVILFTGVTKRLARADGSTEQTSDPDFPVLPVEVDGGLSKSAITVADPETSVARCPARKDIYVRHGAVPFDHYGRSVKMEVDEWVSAWHSGRKVLSRHALSYTVKGFAHTQNDAIVIKNGTISRCTIPVKNARTSCAVLGDVKSLGTAGPDRTGSSALFTPGALAATFFVGDPKLCDSLIQDDGQSKSLNPDNHQGLYLSEGQPSLKFGDQDGVSDVIYNLNRGADDRPAFTSVYDFNNSGVPQLVVRVWGTTRSFPGSFFVTVPLSDASKDAIDSVVRSYSSADRDGPPLPAGWQRFDGSQTDYGGWRYVNFQAGRIEGVTYLLAWSTVINEKPLAILLKPSPDGSLTKTCSYERGEADY